MLTDIDLSDLYKGENTLQQARILRILDEGLHSSQDTAAAAAKLMSDLRQYFASADSGQAGSGFLWDLAFKIKDIVEILPCAEHPWHDVLAVTLHGLRRQGGPVTEFSRTQKWGDLPNLSDFFHDMLCADITEPEFKEDVTPQSLEHWKMFNSFASRLLTDDYQTLFLFPYFRMTGALETAPQDPTQFDCKVWIAAEWLIRCGEILHRDLGEILTEEESQAPSNVKPGPLAEGSVLPISLQRWNFWRSRLVELARAKPFTGNGVQPVVRKDPKPLVKKEGMFVPEEFVLSSTTLAHVQKAIDAMDLINEEAIGVMDSVKQKADCAVESGNRWWIAQWALSWFRTRSA